MNFYHRLKYYRYGLKIMTHQQYRTIRGQYGSGDREGAERGLAKLVERWRKRNADHQSQD